MLTVATLSPESPVSATYDPAKAVVLPPAPHAKDFFFNGVGWLCKCGETDCEFMESGFSPKKEEPPALLNQWRPNLVDNGSSSSDYARSQAKVNCVSKRENGKTDSLVQEPRQSKPNVNRRSESKQREQKSQSRGFSSHQGPLAPLKAKQHRPPGGAGKQWMLKR